jgi:hypothetical protein
VRADITLPSAGVVIECKAIESELREAHLPQIITYMNILGYDVGIFANFIQHPAKPGVQTYQVKRTSTGFAFNETSSDKVYILDTLGNLVREESNIKQWFQENIQQMEKSMLSKEECKQLFPSKSREETRKLVEYIEQQCGQQFKNHQIKSVRYRNTITGWSLRLGSHKKTDTDLIK